MNSAVSTPSRPTARNASASTASDPVSSARSISLRRPPDIDAAARILTWKSVPAVIDLSSLRRFHDFALAAQSKVWLTLSGCDSARYTSDDGCRSGPRAWDDGQRPQWV